jgi:uncharacterized protein (DUF1684 family)
MRSRLRPSSVFLLTALLAGAAASFAADAKEKPARPADYRQEIEAWRKERADGLRKEDGWLTLVGLFWLHPGANRFGSDAGLDLERHLLPYQVQAAGQALKTDNDEGGPTTLKLGSLSFYVIKRGDRFGVRIKDAKSPALASFKGLDNFPLRPDWRVVARFEPYKDKKIAVANVIGQVDQVDSPGAVVFTWKGKTYRLDAIGGSEKEGFFLVFGDQTNGKETYGAGRFLDTAPVKDGKVVVDFNTAYNPPCAFTAFATCPLPPKENKLALRIDAGEKKFAGGPDHH